EPFTQSRMRCHAGPVFTAVFRQKDCALRADSHAMLCVRKADGFEPGLRERVLIMPRLAAVIRVDDSAACADGPPALRIDEVDTEQVFFNFRNDLGPGESAIRRAQDYSLLAYHTAL